MAIRSLKTYLFCLGFWRILKVEIDLSDILKSHLFVFECLKFLNLDLLLVLRDRKVGLECNFEWMQFRLQFEASFSLHYPVSPDNFFWKRANRPEVELGSFDCTISFEKHLPLSSPSAHWMYGQGGYLDN